MTLGLDHGRLLSLPRTLAVGESGRSLAGVGSREHGKNESGDHKGLKTLQGILLQKKRDKWDNNSGGKQISEDVCV